MKAHFFYKTICGGLFVIVREMHINDFIQSLLFFLYLLLALLQNQDSYFFVLSH